MATVQGISAAVPAHKHARTRRAGRRPDLDARRRLQSTAPREPTRAARWKGTRSGDPDTRQALPPWAENRSVATSRDRSRPCEAEKRPPPEMESPARGPACLELTRRAVARPPRLAQTVSRRRPLAY